jgi:transcriptional regulator with XRE-family HTH domain
LLERVTGTPHGSQARLARLLGCRATTVSTWEHGRARPSPVYARKLVEIERSLHARPLSVVDEIKSARPDVVTTSPALAPSVAGSPLVATSATVTLEGDQALLRFVLKVPGELEPRHVADVLVSKAVFAGLLATFYPSK